MKISDKEPIILLDMDGVLADFVTSSIDAASLPIREQDVTDWDYYKPFCSVDEFWERIGAVSDFWLNLEKYKWANDLYRMCSMMARTIIATSPSACRQCPSQKVAWLRQYGFLEKSVNDYMLGPHKELMARPNTILIDDSDRNVENFITAGGNAITFPQKWNKSRSVIGARLDYVEARLQMLVGQIVTG